MKTAEAPIGVVPTEISFREKLRHNDHALAPVSKPKLGPTNATLIGLRADILMIGGASIIACLLYWMFVGPTTTVDNVAVLAFYLSFVINFPHFASSYQLLYGNYRKLILKKKSFFWAAVVAPVLIAISIGVGISMSSQAVLAFLVQTMFLTVGWHYVKQIYGVSLVTSAVQKRYFGTWEKNLILLNLYSVWALSWVNANLSIAKQDLDGVNYYTLGLPEWMLTAVYAATAITFLAAAVVMVRKYIKTGVRPATSSLVGFASIYFWYLPSLGHPLFFYMIPFFHSLQYMLFIVAMKKNDAERSAKQEVSGEAQRKVFMKKFWGFLALATVLGALGFQFIPRGLDQVFPIGKELPYAALWFFAINLFINLHHYFIDNVIWRGDNEYLKANLIQASQTRAMVQQ